jgi:ABC-type polar amino acid transport system ATPase subunit
VIKLIQLTKRYSNDTVLDGISMDICKGDVIGLIGPSGSGKSTVLRCIAGIEEYDTGKIIVDENCRIGMVFQNFNLFNNMSVIENLCYPQQKVLKRTKNNAEGIAIQMLKKVNMMGFFDRFPSSLSGGQKQRVAIARTLCMDPSIILFDEPTSALDPENVSEVLDVIKSIATDEIGIIIVTHELRFIRSIANRMIFIDHGKIEVDMEKDDFFQLTSSKRINSFLESLLSH